MVQLANKRQRKKQQTKQNVEILKAAGKNKKFIKENKNNKKVVKKVDTYEKKKRKYQQRSDLIKALGLKMNRENSKKRGWSDERFNSWYASELEKKKKREKKEQRKRKDLNDNYLLIFWRDKTAEGYSDYDAIKLYIQSYKYLNDAQLIENINYYLRSKTPVGSEIGTAINVVVKGSQINQYINFMSHFSDVTDQYSDSNDWLMIYKGKAVRIHELLVAIHAIVSLCYDAYERADFISDLLYKKLPLINEKMARRLIKAFNWRDI